MNNLIDVDHIHFLIVGDTTTYAGTNKALFKNEKLSLDIEGTIFQYETNFGKPLILKLENSEVKRVEALDDFTFQNEKERIQNYLSKHNSRCKDF
ncbi:hypothetical protein [Roseivirga sp.]|uniref:hypothetical protein n=1 Tax=Roseivirga sp. TaxID=1964215 RepID=UPI003B8B63CE